MVATIKKKLIQFHNKSEANSKTKKQTNDSMFVMYAPLLLLVVGPKNNDVLV